MRLAMGISLMGVDLLLLFVLKEMPFDWLSMAMIGAFQIVLICYTHSTQLDKPKIE